MKIIKWITSVVSVYAIVGIFFLAIPLVIAIILEITGIVPMHIAFAFAMLFTFILVGASAQR